MSYRSKSRAAACLAVVLTLVLTIAPGHAAPQSSPAAPLQSSGLADLQRSINRILSTPAVERTDWGVLVQSLRSGETVYALNPGRLMMPASTLKVVTLAAAAERLGWDYSYETRVVADGPIDNDTLQGNLVIVGSGDPSLNRRTIDQWAAQLRGLGVRNVSGTVLADARLFKGQGLGPGWSWDDLAYYYAAPVAAVQFSENAVDLIVQPGASPGALPLYQLTPAAGGLRIENRMTTGAASAAAEFVARREPSSTVVVIEGVVPAGSRPVVRTLSVPDPARFLTAAFTESLIEAGIVVVGGSPPADVNVDSARPYSGGLALVTHRSEPLRVLARRLMGVSQNQYAETLLKTLGVQSGAPTFDGGVKAVESVLSAWDIPVEGTALRDGSGLSRYNYVTADTLVRVLTRMYRDPLHREPFFSSLTVVGRTGTVAERMKNTPAAGNAQVKDGALAGVRALCGVIAAADGEPLVFAVLANGFAVPGPTITAAIDAIAVQLASFRR